MYENSHVLSIRRNIMLNFNFEDALHLSLPHYPIGSPLEAGMPCWGRSHSGSHPEVRHQSPTDPRGKNTCSADVMAYRNNVILGYVS